jgi:hypothetical protein
LLSASGAVAGKRTSETFEFSDPFSGSFDCGDFTATLSGHDKGPRHDLVRRERRSDQQIGRIQATETDANTTTGASIDVKTRLNVHIDFLPARRRSSGSGTFRPCPGRAWSSSTSAGW